MKIVYKDYWLLPPPGFTAIMWFGRIIAKRKAEPLSVRIVNHESIHEAQAKECGGWVRFYLMYLRQWVRVGFKYGKIPFEREAYCYDGDLAYLENRMPFAWTMF